MHSIKIHTCYIVFLSSDLDLSFVHILNHSCTAETNIYQYVFNGFEEAIASIFS